MQKTDNQKALITHIHDELCEAEEDAAFWKMKAKGEWPTDRDKKRLPVQVDDSKLSIPYEVWRSMKRVVAASMGIGEVRDGEQEVVVSAEAVRDLWKKLEEYEKAIRKDGGDLV